MDVSRIKIEAIQSLRNHRKRKRGASSKRNKKSNSFTTDVSPQATMQLNMRPDTPFPGSAWMNFRNPGASNGIAGFNPVQNTRQQYLSPAFAARNFPPR